MANDSQAFYEDPVAELSQGDIIHISPHSFLDPPLRSISLSDAGVPAVSDLSLSNIEGCGKIVAECRPSTALLLNYDCEIAKPTTKRLVVCPILPLAQFSPTDQGNIRRNRTAHLFFLPRFRQLEDSVAVLNQITTIHRVLLSDLHRIVTLSEIGRLGFYAQFVRWLTRWEMRTVSCPNCRVEFDPTLSLPLRSAGDP
jgi:hypothetical protein